MFSNQVRKLLFLSVTVSCVAFYCFFVTERAFAATYYIAANGSDGNTAAQATNTCPGAQCTPWQHAPGMSGCTANCAAFTPQPGDRFILRGGDTWHNTGGGTPVGIPWEWKWNGTPANRIYVGVAQNWFNSAVCGSSWCRPKLNGDNPLSTSAVASCQFQSGNANVINVFLHTTNADYIDWEGFEMLGLCWNNTSGGFGQVGYVISGGIFSTYVNFYIHGWTHTDFNSPVNTLDAGFAWEGCCRDPNPGSDLGTCISNTLIDGADSDVHSFQAVYGSPQCWHHNVIRNVASMASIGAFNVHDNLVEYISWSGRLDKHINTFQTFDGPSLFYNNLIRHIGVDRFGVSCTTTCPQNLNFTPSNSGTDYVFNNVIYDIVPAANVVNVDAHDGPAQATSSIFIVNNTIHAQGLGAPATAAGYCINFDAQGVFLQSVTVRNNHCITNLADGFIFNPNNWTFNQSNNLRQTESAAQSQGYTATNNYAPVAKQSGTVGQGVALSALCPVAGVALCSDTTLGSTRQPVNRLSTWDIGAYKFTFAGPPTLRVVAVH